MNQDNNLNNDKKTCNKNVEYFEQKFREFFKKECVENDINKLHEGYLRIYWLCLNLANGDKTLPLSRYKDNFIIGKMIDDCSKLPIEQIKASVK